VDTGWGAAFMIATVREISRAGTADCTSRIRCGEALRASSGKALVPTEEMVDRIKAAVDARTDARFVVMARTDAHSVEGQRAALERAQAYVAAGADMIFAEALKTLDEYREFTRTLPVPVLANITEFGQTPLYTTTELRDAGVRLVLYPLSAFRAMSAAAQAVYATLRHDGTQRDLIDCMQTRAELYDVLGYHDYEKKLDELFTRGGSGEVVPALLRPGPRLGHAHRELDAMTELKAAPRTARHGRGHDRDLHGRLGGSRSAISWLRHRRAGRAGQLRGSGASAAERAADTQAATGFTGRS
jgi:methylisocitrate lyase